MIKSILGIFKKKEKPQEIKNTVIKNKSIVENKIIHTEIYKTIIEMGLEYEEIFFVSVVDIDFKIKTENLKFSSLFPTIANKTKEIEIDVKDEVIYGDLLLTLSAYKEINDESPIKFNLEFKDAKINLFDDCISVNPDSLVR